MADYRVLVTGSRDLEDRRIVFDALDKQLAQLPAGDTLVVVHGASGNTDIAAACWATLRREYGKPVRSEPHHPDWLRHGRSAGPIRNQRMVQLGAHICLAFYQPGTSSRGTADCVHRAGAAGIPVHHHHPKEA